MHRIEIILKKHVPDARGLGLVGDIADLGIKSVSAAQVRDIYYLDAKLTPKQLDAIGRELLADPVTQDYRCDVLSSEEKKPGVHVVEVAYKAGVVDPVEETVIIGLTDLGIKNVKAVKTAKLYILEGKLTKEQLEDISSKTAGKPHYPSCHYLRGICFQRQSAIQIRIETSRPDGQRKSRDGRTEVKLHLFRYRTDGSPGLL